MVFYLFLLLLLLGRTLVFYSLSPYYAALGLVLTSIFGCIILSCLGLSFLALLLLLVYMGGMMVVFVYSSALSADRYPIVRNLGEVFIIFFLLSIWVFFIFEDLFEFSVNKNIVAGCVDLRRLSILYDLAGSYLILGGVALLVVLVVALVVSWGHDYSSLRSL